MNVVSMELDDWEEDMKKIILYIASVICGMIFGIGWLAKKCESELINRGRRAERNGKSVRVACKWIREMQEGKRIASYFEKYGFKSVAVYGAGELGKCMVQELEKNGIEIKYIIDSNPNARIGDYKCFLPDGNDLPKVQAVIVTPSYDFEEISRILTEQTSASIVSIDEIPYNI